MRVYVDLFIFLLENYKSLFFFVFLMGIPPQATRAFKGDIFSVYQWEQKLYDGSIHMFEMLKRPDSVKVIATFGESVFLGFEEQPNRSEAYNLFGGRCEDGEEPLETARRELLEETGMVCVDWELFTVYDFSEIKIDWKLYIYIARNCRRVAEPKLDPGEKIRVEEVSFERFMELGMRNGFRWDRFCIDLLKIHCDKKKLAEFKGKLFGR